MFFLFFFFFFLTCVTAEERTGQDRTGEVEGKSQRKKAKEEFKHVDASYRERAGERSTLTK